jgi:hypothetical protein
MRKSARYVELWRQIIREERQKLYATPQRVAEIERRQPEAESRGRSLFYRPEESVRRRKPLKNKQRDKQIRLTDSAILIKNADLEGDRPEDNPDVLPIIDEEQDEDEEPLDVAA